MKSFSALGEEIFDNSEEWQNVPSKVIIKMTHKNKQIKEFRTCALFLMRLELFKAAVMRWQTQSKDTGGIPVVQLELIPQTNCPAMVAVIRSIFTEHVRIDSNTELDELLCMLYAADFIGQVDAVAQVCECLETRMTTDSVFKTLNAAHALNREALVKAAIEYICENPAALNSPSICDLDENAMIKLLMSFNEDEQKVGVCDAVMFTIYQTWLYKRCNVEQSQDVHKQFMDCFTLVNMPVEYIYEVVRPTGMYSTEELLEAVIQIAKTRTPLIEQVLGEHQQMHPQMSKTAPTTYNIKMSCYQTLLARIHGRTTGQLYFEASFPGNRMPNCPQLGVAGSGFKNTQEPSKDGVGDCTSSWAVDGPRGLKWHVGSHAFGEAGAWVVGMVIGIAIDFGKDGACFRYTCNGDWTSPTAVVFENMKFRVCLYPAVTGSYGEISMNLGGPFRYDPPTSAYRPWVEQ